MMARESSRWRPHCPGSPGPTGSLEAADSDGRHRGDARRTCVCCGQLPSGMMDMTCGGTCTFVSARFPADAISQPSRRPQEWLSSRSKRDPHRDSRATRPSDSNAFNARDAHEIHQAPHHTLRGRRTERREERRARGDLQADGPSGVRVPERSALISKRKRLVVGSLCCQRGHNVCRPPNNEKGGPRL